jgi:hypothetical protein
MQWPKEKGQSLIYKTLHRKLSFPPERYIFSMQCEQNTCTISNRDQFNLKTRVQFYVIRQQMKQKKKLVCNFTCTSLDPPQRYIFSQETKIIFLFFGHEKKWVISLQIVIINFSLRTVGNPRSTALEASTLTITPPMQFVLYEAAWTRPRHTFMSLRGQPFNF